MIQLWLIQCHEAMEITSSATCHTQSLFLLFIFHQNLTFLIKSQIKLIKYS